MASPQCKVSCRMAPAVAESGVPVAGMMLGTTVKKKDSVKTRRVDERNTGVGESEVRRRGGVGALAMTCPSAVGFPKPPLMPWAAAKVHRLRLRHSRQVSNYRTQLGVFYCGGFRPLGGTARSSTHVSSVGGKTGGVTVHGRTGTARRFCIGGKTGGVTVHGGTRTARRFAPTMTRLGVSMIGNRTGITRRRHHTPTPLLACRSLSKLSFRMYRIIYYIMPG